jgi:hypothetical protein
METDTKCYELRTGTPAGFPFETTELLKNLQ